MINDSDLLDSETQSHVPMSLGNRRAQFLERGRSTLGEAETVQSQKFEVVTSYKMPENEKVIYAGFLYDQNPTFVLIITINEEENCSYLSLGKINSEHNSAE